MNSLLGFSFSPPVINPLSDSSLTRLGQQSCASGSHKSGEGQWSGSGEPAGSKRTSSSHSWFLTSRLDLGSDFLADFLLTADNTHSLLVTAVLVKFHVLLLVHTCYSDCRRSHWVACRPSRQHHAGPPWPHQSWMFPSQVILAPRVKPVSIFNAISHLRVVWFSVCFHFSGPLNYLHISCIFIL